MKINNGYTLARVWFDFIAQTPEVTTNHTAIYLYAVDLCNRLRWQPTFGFPSYAVMDAVHIKSYNSYKKCFNDLIQWGFFVLVQKSTNQHQARLIALSNFDKAEDIAKDNAPTLPYQKMTQQMTQQNSHNKTSKTDKTILISKKQFVLSLQLFKTLELILQDQSYVERLSMNFHLQPDSLTQYLKVFFVELDTRGEIRKTEQDAKQHFSNWLKMELEKQETGKNQKGGYNAIPRKANQTIEHGSIAQLTTKTSEDYSIRFSI